MLSREFPAISIGTEVPNAQFCDVNGRKLSLLDFRGKTVIIHYWATWCGPCMDEIDSLSKRLDSLDKDKYTVLFVSLDLTWILMQKESRNYQRTLCLRVMGCQRAAH